MTIIILLLFHVLLIDYYYLSFFYLLMKSLLNFPRRDLFNILINEILSGVDYIVSCDAASIFIVLNIMLSMASFTQRESSYYKIPTYTAAYPSF